MRRFKMDFFSIIISCFTFQCFLNKFLVLEHIMAFPRVKWNKEAKLLIAIHMKIASTPEQPNTSVHQDLNNNKKLLYSIFYTNICNSTL